jgi:Rrf2 family protein
MMSYSTSFPHAILAMLYITDTIQHGKFDFVPIQHISTELNIPPSTMGLIIRQLNRAGLVETREGAKGGIRHARSPATITIYDIFKAIEQERPLFQTLLNPRVTGTKPTQAQAAIVAVLQNAEQSMIQPLQQTTLADLLHELSA